MKWYESEPLCAEEKRVEEKNVTWRWRLEKTFRFTCLPFHHPIVSALRKRWFPADRWSKEFTLVMAYSQSCWHTEFCWHGVKIYRERLEGLINIFEQFYFAHFVTWPCRCMLTHAASKWSFLFARAFCWGILRANFIVNHLFVDAPCVLNASWGQMDSSRACTLVSWLLAAGQCLRASPAIFCTWDTNFTHYTNMMTG